MSANKPSDVVIPSAEQIGDLRLAASKLTGSARRAFQAEMALKYCGGSARRAERVFGWDRQAVACGLGERRTGIECLGAHAAFAGRPRWETRHPQAAAVLRMKRCVPRALPRSSCPRRAPWPRCSIAWAIGCAR